MSETDLPTHPRETQETQETRETRARLQRILRLRVILAVALVALLGGGAAWAITAALQETATPAAPSTTTQPPSVPPTPEPTPEPAPARSYDLDTPTSVTVVVNKQRPLNPIDWAPEDLVLPAGTPNVWGHPIRSEAASALEQMYAAASAAGVPFTITSGYRDFGMQQSIYEDLVAQGGVEFADRDTARPGYSEHQTGLAVDLFGEEGCQLDACFGETATGLWLRENAFQFGYILRYDDGQQATVGYTYEPWHFRYVGVDVSTAMHDQGIANLEDFFGLPPAPTN